MNKNLDSIPALIISIKVVNSHLAHKVYMSKQKEQQQEHLQMTNSLCAIDTVLQIA